MTTSPKAIDLLSPEQAVRVGEWCSTHRAALDTAARVAGRRACELSGVIYEVAAAAVRKRELGDLAPARALARALRREADDCVVRRERGGEHPVVVNLDEMIDAVMGDLDPERLLMDAECARERADLENDHDDRLSYVAQRAAKGHQPVMYPTTSHQSRARSGRRYRSRDRDLREAGQQDFWLGRGGAAA